jgi:hypothetical protein
MGLINLRNKYYDFMPLDIQRFATVMSLSVTETSYSVANNTSEVTATITMSRTGSTTTWWSNAKTGTITIDGQEKTFSITWPKSSATATASVSATVGHNTDGSKSIYVSAYLAVSGVSGSPFTTSGTYTLTTIPRYANITTFYLSNLSGYDGINNINFTWGADASCDAVQYSLNGGGWTDGVFPTTTIGGLSHNTQYSVRIRVKRADSQLWTESDTKYITTKDINRITSGQPNISNGSALRVTASNPSGASCQISVEVPAGTRRYTKSGTDVTFSVDEINSLIDHISITDQASSIRVTADTLDNSGNIGYYRYVGGTYTIINSEPEFNHFEFEDVNEKTLDLMGKENKKNCIIGYSEIQGTIPLANKMTTKNNAEPTKYRFTVGSQSVDIPYSGDDSVSGSINNVTSGHYEMIAIDSRGFSSKKVEFDSNEIIYYTDLVKDSNVSAIRVNTSGEVTGVDEHTRISFSGTMWVGNFGDKDNALSVSYQYKKSSDEDWTIGKTTITPTISDSKFSFKGNIQGDTDNGFDISNTYQIQVIVSDKLSSVTYSMNLGSGTPHVAYAQNGVGIMGKYDDEAGGKLQIAGVPVLEYDIIDTW